VSFEVVAELDGAADRSVYELGWQSWSPSGLYPATATSARPTSPLGALSYRAGSPPPDDGFQGEGLLAVTDPDGGVTVVSAPHPAEAVPSIRARVRDGVLQVSADGPVRVWHDPRGLAPAVESWADEVAVAAGVGGADGLRLRSHPPAWGSWYCYWNAVTEDDLRRTLLDLDRLELDAPVVQLDDGYQAGVGNWLATNDRFGPLADVASRILDTGRGAGLWTAPLLVDGDGDLARRHPDWLVADLAPDMPNWGVPLRVLDVTHPDAAEHLATVFRRLVEWGFTLHKCDFLYVGAMAGRRRADVDGVAAYREALRLIRDAIGPDATLLACGAPLLPAVGLVDLMRVSPDVNPVYGPLGDDWSQPGIAPAIADGAARVWQHGRWWANDPDCIIVRPGEVPDRDEWAAYLGSSPGLRVSSDHLDRLDEHGLDLTRQLLVTSEPRPVPWRPARFPGPARGPA
jgi:alpha-galactosidase